MRIETERLIIDRVREEDKENYFVNISHDKEVLKTFVCRYQENLDDFDFSVYLGREDLYAIREKENGQFIGIFVECDVDIEKGTMEIGYGLGSQHWGKGYATEVVRAMLSHYFVDRGFKTVYGSFFPENTSSKHVMEKCGMTYSHTNEKEFEYLGKERDLIYYKILR